MSEERVAKRQVSRAEFVRLVDAMRTHRERFTREKPGWWEACAILHKLTGIHPAKTTCMEVCEAAGVTWQTPRKSPVRRDSNSSRIRTLVRALRTLYRKLGEEVPSGLESLWVEMTTTPASDNGSDKSDAPCV